MATNYNDDLLRVARQVTELAKCVTRINEAALQLSEIVQEQDARLTAIEKSLPKEH